MCDLFIFAAVFTRLLTANDIFLKFPKILLLWFDLCSSV